MRVSCRRLLVGLSTAFIAASAAPVAQVTPAQASIDLRSAVVVTSVGPTAREKKAVQALVEEVQKRTLITLPVATSAIAGRPSIYIGRVGSLPGGAGSSSAGLSKPGCPRVSARRDWQRRGCGSDRGRRRRARRPLRRRPAAPRVADGSDTPSPSRPSLRLATAPQTPLRGHQLGYRPKTNSYDGWTVAMWEQYIRDLVVFGCNAIELIPPRSDDDADSPHLPAAAARDDGRDVAARRRVRPRRLDLVSGARRDYADPKTVEFALKEWGDVFKALPRVDAVLVPGGDPGHTRPRRMFALLEKQTANLRKYPPEGGDVGVAAGLHRGRG